MHSVVKIINNGILDILGNQVAFYSESEKNILSAQLESADIKATLSMSRNKFVYQCSVQGNFYLAR